MPRRHAFALLLCALLGVGPALGQTLHWDVLPDAPVVDGFRHDDVQFLDSQRGWVVNQAGRIWYTPDAGASWQMQHDQRGIAFRSIAVTDDSTAFAGTILTPGHALWATTDGGAQWVDISDRIVGPDVAALCGMWPLNDHTVVAVGAFYGEARIVRTTDNGRTWQSIDATGWAPTLVDVYFRDETTGFATGGSSQGLDGNTIIIRTDDGGLTWRKVYESTKPPGVDGEWGWKFSFPTPEIGYLAVEYSNNDLQQPAKILKTTDGGETWSEVFIEGSVSKAGLQAVGFISPTVGWAGGRGVTSMTTDGGESWTQLAHYNTSFQTGQLDGSINRFVVVNDTFAVAIGQRIYTLEGLSTTTSIEPGRAPVDRRDGFRLLPAYPNPFRESTRLVIELDAAMPVRVQVIDMLGRRHGELLTGHLGAGRHEAVWDGRGPNGAPLPSGLYLFLIDIGDAREMKQAVQIR